MRLPWGWRFGIHLLGSDELGTGAKGEHGGSRLNMGGANIVLAPDARRRLVRGMSVPVRAISAAYGPQGRGVVCHIPPAAPEILFDGLAIAREFQPGGSVERQGARILYETLFDFDRDFGDGNSSLALVTYGILAASLSLVEAGHDPNLLAETLLGTAGLAVSGLGDISQPFTFDCHALGLCRSVVGGFPEVAREVVSLVSALGPEGQVVVREGSGPNVRTALHPGMTLPAGLVSPALSIQSSGGSMVYDDAHILLCDERIEDFGRLVPILEGFARAKKTLVILCRDVIGTALATLIVNARNGGLRVGAVAVPEVGERVYEVLVDIGALTGGEVVSERLGRCLHALRPEMLGRAERVEVSANHCILICKHIDHRRLESRKEAIRDEIRRTRYLSYDREKLELRLARLAGGVAEVEVGAQTLLEQRHLVRRYQKAVRALQSARRSAVVPGGGSTFSYLASHIERSLANRNRKAVNVMFKWALRQPERQLVRSVRSDLALLPTGRERGGFGSLSVFDVCKRAYSTSETSGIIDSAEIVDEVVRRAVSTAATVLRSEVSVSSNRQATARGLFV